VPFLPEGPQGQLQPEAARLSCPQHEVRPVPEEGEGGQGQGAEEGAGPQPRRLVRVHAQQLGGNTRQVILKNWAPPIIVANLF
jgi:hypothetical protein